MCLCVFITFFFFKQKTAYEMRISDWSSDVCSSDLGSLGQGIRIIKRYVQSHQVDVDFLDADQNRYEGIAEVWFDSEADAAAFVTDPDYVAYALKDEPNFVDMDNFFAVFAREEVLKSRAEALR